ncbi:FxsA family membrane protein [Streptomyces xinghaiensis]|uniref:FxsA family membrane protein n=1 Tax=Streptomyces xinghaiensis TaxID=1038928 RepID=UPI000BAFAA51|nr:FxsA family membrane protein [Streptomyces xinghaiensis]MZE81692.1 FxsA family protein [Streptomyces sp. SID5475]
MTTGVPHRQEEPPGRGPGSTAARTGRSRRRSLVPLAVAAWVVLEIWLLTLVADAFGGLTVLLLLLAGLVLGAYVVKRAGRRAWRGLTENLQRGTAPGAPPAEGSRASGNTLPMLGGLLLMMPGLVSDVAGLLCLFPPTRALLRRSAERSLSRRMSAAGPGGLGEAFQQARMHRPDGKVVQGEVIHRDGEDGHGENGDGEGKSGRGGEPPLPR